MVLHTVCFKLKDNSESSKREAVELILSMNGKVPSAVKVTAGADFLGSQRSYDVILQAYVEDRDALTAYADDPYHCSVVKAYMAEHALSSITVDCEL